MPLKFSLIIPLALYRDCPILESINELNYPKEGYEVIIKKGTNPSVNRNKGIEEAKAEILVFLDDDAVVDKGLLKNAEDFFSKYPEIDIVGGPQLTPKDDPFFARISGYLISSFFATHRMAVRYKKAKLNLNANEDSLSSANVFFKKKVFDKIAGFDPDLFPGEDPELFARAKNVGFKIAYSPDLIIYHKRRPNLKSFCKQFFLYGIVRPKKEKKSKGNFNLINSLVWITPSLFVIYLVVLPLAYFLIHKLLIVPFVLYAFLAVFSSLITSIKNKSFISFFILPFLYLLIHVSYGLGMIVGIVKK